MCAGFTLLKIMVLTKRRPPTSNQRFQLKSRLKFILILTLREKLALVTGVDRLW
jgi:hypothetical protein